MGQGDRQVDCTLQASETGEVHLDRMSFRLPILDLSSSRLLVSSSPRLLAGRR